MIVAGMATRNESRSPRESGHPGLLQTATKLSSVTLNGDRRHHPRLVWSRGRTAVIATPTKGSNHASSIAHPTTWITMVRPRMPTHRDHERIGARLLGADAFTRSPRRRPEPRPPL